MTRYVALFTYQRADYDAFARAYDKQNGRTFGLWLLKLAGWLALALFLVPFISLAIGLKWDQLGDAWQTRDGFLFEVSRAAPYVLGCSFLFGGLYWLAWHRQLNRQKIFQHECRVEIDESGILCEYAGIRHKADWPWFTGRYEESDVVILLGKTEGYMAIPKRGFVDPAMFDGALTLIRSKVSALS